MTNPVHHRHRPALRRRRPSLLRRTRAAPCRPTPPFTSTRGRSHDPGYGEPARFDPAAEPAAADRLRRDRDMRGTALVANDATVDWLCLARFDADPVFLGLLDAGQAARARSPSTARSGRAGSGTGTPPNILETRLDGPNASVTVTDSCRSVGWPTSVTSGPTARRRAGWSASFAAMPVRPRSRSASIRASIGAEPYGDAGPDRTVRLLPGGDLPPCVLTSTLAHRTPVTTRAVLREGETLTLVMAHAGPIDARAVEDARTQLAETEDYWTEWHGLSRYAGPGCGPRRTKRPVPEAADLCPDGAMVAAATTGSRRRPEASGTGITASCGRGTPRSASPLPQPGSSAGGAEFLRFLHRACDEGEVVRVMYGWTDRFRMSGGSTILRLARLQAGARRQRGEWAEAARDLRRAPRGPELVRVGARHRRPMSVPAETSRVSSIAGRGCARNLEGPGPGDLGAPRSRAISCIPRRCAGSPSTGPSCWPRASASTPSHWEAERDAIRAECMARGWNDRVGALTMEYGPRPRHVDAAAVAHGHGGGRRSPMTATLEASDRALGEGDLYWRYPVSTTAAG